MPLEFITPREPLPTEEPVADKGPLAGVQAHVGPQQGRLPESLATVGDMAHVLLLALLSRPENGGWGRGKGKRSKGGGRRWGQDRMERMSPVREHRRRGGGQVVWSRYLVPSRSVSQGEAWGTGHLPGWQSGSSPPITSCPRPCSWDMCRPCGAASRRAGPLQTGPAPSAAGSGWGSAHLWSGCSQKHSALSAAAALWEKEGKVPGEEA